VNRNQDRGGLIDPMGAENVKHTGVEKLAGGSTPDPLDNSHPVGHFK